MVDQELNGDQNFSIKIFERWVEWKERKKGLHFFFFSDLL